MSLILYFRILYGSVGANGKQADGGIFNRSSFKERMDNNLLQLPPSMLLPGSTTWSNFHMIGDDAFSLSTRMMKPFPGNIEGSLSQKIEMRVFDYRLLFFIYFFIFL